MGGVSELAVAMRAKRLAMRLSQQEMGAMLGVSQEMVSMIESGRKPVPRALRPLIRGFVDTGAVR